MPFTWLATRPATTTLAVVLAIALAGALGACSHHDPVPMSGLDLTADVDPTHGTIVEPMDRFRDSPEDDAITADAQQVAMSLCAKEKGISWVPVFMDSTYDRRNGPVEGPWTRKDAAKFGFITPEADGDLRRSLHPGLNESDRLPGDKPSANEALSEADHEIVRACGAAPEAMRFDLHRVTPQGPWDVARQAAQEKVFPLSETGPYEPSEETKPVEDDYDACLQAADAEPDPDRVGWAKGADSQVLNPQQIALALTVVDCKTQVHYAQRLADIEAKLEAPIVEKYGRELTARKEKIDAVVADAKKFLAAHPDVRPTG